MQVTQLPSSIRLYIQNFSTAPGMDDWFLCLVSAVALSDSRARVWYISNVDVASVVVWPGFSFPGLVACNATIFKGRRVMKRLVLE